MLLKFLQTQKTPVQFFTAGVLNVREYKNYYSLSFLTTSNPILTLTSR